MCSDTIFVTQARFLAVTRESAVSVTQHGQKQTTLTGKGHSLDNAKDQTRDCCSSTMRGGHGARTKTALRSTFWQPCGWIIYSTTHYNLF